MVGGGGVRPSLKKSVCATNKHTINFTASEFELTISLAMKYKAVV